MIFFAVFMGICLFFVACIVFFILVAYNMVHPPREIRDWKPSDWDCNFETIEINTRDGLRLRGWWIEQESTKTIILLHGYTTSRWNQTYMKPMLKLLTKEEYNILTFDFRAHGESEGNTTSIGNQELIDLQSAIDWLEQYHSDKTEKLGVIGYSMGGIVTLRGMMNDERITCGIADSPPIILGRTSARSIKYFANIPAFFYPLIKPFTMLFSDVFPFNLLDKADRITKPLLLIAGKQDPIVKYGEVQKFHEQNKTVNKHSELLLSEAKHVRTIQLDPKAYEERVHSFLTTWMS